MAKGFTITCLAYSFGSLSGIQARKGQSFTFPAEHPYCLELAGNPAFKFEPCEVPDLKPVVSEPDKGEGDAGVPSGDDDITLVKLEPALLEVLQDGGYTTVDSVLLAGQDELTKLNGVGKATADKIVAACQAYLAG